MTYLHCAVCVAVPMWLRDVAAAWLSIEQSRCTLTSRELQPDSKPKRCSCK